MKQPTQHYGIPEVHVYGGGGKPMREVYSLRAYCGTTTRHFAAHPEDLTCKRCLARHAVLMSWQTGHTEPLSH